MNIFLCMASRDSFIVYVSVMRDGIRFVLELRSRCVSVEEELKV